MAQMTVELAEAILKGDGITRHEVEQLCHFFLANKPRIKLEQELIQAQAELAEAKKDQARYQWLLHGIGAAELLPDPPKWTFRNIPKCNRNVFKGSVAQHFSDAVDLTIK